MAYGILSAVLIYHILYYLDCNLLSIPELLWNSLVYVTPTSAISFFDERLRTRRAEDNSEEGRRYSPRGLAAKSEAMRRIFGLEGTVILTNIQRARSLSGLSTVFRDSQSGGIPGLGNWDNSCYQNSIIQGLASLSSLSAFLDQVTSSNTTESAHTTKEALKNIISRLNDPSNAGQRLWTPVELKSMSSWQQQDAQEYYSKVLDEIEKEVSKDANRGSYSTGLADIKYLGISQANKKSMMVTDIRKPPDGILETKAKTLNNFEQLPAELASSFLRNPLEGLLAQRVGCLQCGFVEGLSLIPFNCLTLPLGRQWSYDIEACFNEYTTLEPISGVECAKCTLLHHKVQLERLLGRASRLCANGDTLLNIQLPESLRKPTEARLGAVNEALAEEDFSENTLLKKCQISTKSRISTTKSRQAVVTRAPRSLALHFNRSLFDEFTGMQSKNYADVRFSMELDIAPWTLGYVPWENGQEILESWNINPATSMLPNEEVGSSNVQACRLGTLYTLRAAITHYGRHENGHYICYRQRPQSFEIPSKSHPKCAWWRLSDDDVSEVSEDHLLSQGGVFMLFYEKVETNDVIGRTTLDSVETNLAVSSITETNNVTKVESVHEEQAGPDDTPRYETSAEQPILPKELTASLPQLESNPQSSDTFPAHDSTSTDPEFSSTTDTDPSTSATAPSTARSESISSVHTSCTSSSSETTPEEPEMPSRHLKHPMRTASPRNGRGSGSRAGKAMATVSSMVTAN